MFNSHGQPACLPSVGVMPPVGKACYISGKIFKVQYFQGSFISKIE